MTTGPHNAPVNARSDRFVIFERAVDHPDATRLLQAFYLEQLDRYGFAEPVSMKPAEYKPPRGAFVVAYHHDTPVGCGGYRLLPAPHPTVEIKKTYLTPTARGHGIGHAILTWLEHHATAAGARQAILETGVRNTSAIRLFTASGYQPTDSYVPGRDPAINRAFTKPLTPPNRRSQRRTLTKGELL